MNEQALTRKNCIDNSIIVMDRIPVKISRFPAPSNPWFSIRRYDPSKIIFPAAQPGNNRIYFFRNGKVSSCPKLPKQRFSF